MRPIFAAALALSAVLSTPAAAQLVPVPLQPICENGQLVGLVFLVPTPAAPAGRFITFPPGMCDAEKPTQPPAAEPPPAPKERPTKAPRTT